MEPPRAAAAAARPESESESRRRRQDAAADTRWLATLSETELGLLMALKEVAVARASNAGHPHLADKVFPLRALRALAFVLLQESKARLRQASSWVDNARILERLALLNDPDPGPDHDPQEVVDNVMPTPNGNRKRKQMQDGYFAAAAAASVKAIQSDPSVVACLSCKHYCNVCRCGGDGDHSPKRRKSTREGRTT